MQENNDNFLDNNTITAIVLSILFFIGWQSYLQKKYPPQPEGQKVATTMEQKEQGAIDAKPVTGEVTQTGAQEVSQPATKVAEQKQSIELPNLSMELTSFGMGLSKIELKQYSDREENNIQFSPLEGDTAQFATLYQGQPVSFLVEKKGENHFVGTAQVGQQQIVKEIIVNSDTYTIDVSLKTLSGTVDKSAEFATFFSGDVIEGESSFLVPSFEGTEFFTINDGDEERERFDVSEPHKEAWSKAVLTSVGSQYFTIALNDSSAIIPRNELSYSPNKKRAYAQVFHKAATNGTLTDIKYSAFFGPKKYDILNKLEPNYVAMINYGIFGALSKPILSLLKWLHSLFANWGIAIILLTIFIRLLLLPINISSLKSMKKMQKIQPQLKAIKEKYKEDPQRVNQETMALMKKEGANPIGGCLPMFLQLPVFLALYSVISQSVELYKSPFMFWIQDLSYKDPFFVLPIAVGALYFVQMSISPQPTDPTQAKMMKFIPLVFCVFMIALPSGLTLYFFVNTIFGIGQQYIFHKDRQKAAA